MEKRHRKRGDQYVALRRAFQAEGRARGKTYVEVRVCEGEGEADTGGMRSQAGVERREVGAEWQEGRAKRLRTLI